MAVKYIRKILFVNFLCLLFFILYAENVNLEKFDYGFFDWNRYVLYTFGFGGSSTLLPGVEEKYFVYEAQKMALKNFLFYLCKLNFDWNKRVGFFIDAPFKASFLLNFAKKYTFVDEGSFIGFKKVGLKVNFYGENGFFNVLYPIFLKSGADEDAGVDRIDYKLKLLIIVEGENFNHALIPAIVDKRNKIIFKAGILSAYRFTNSYYLCYIDEMPDDTSRFKVVFGKRVLAERGFVLRVDEELKILPGKILIYIKD